MDVGNLNPWKCYSELRTNLRSIHMDEDRLVAVRVVATLGQLKPFPSLA